MSDVLKKICDIRLEQVKAAEKLRPFAEVDAAAKALSKTQEGKPRGFRAALEAKAKTGYGLIAEIKKASPSAGLIRPDFDPASLARAYKAGGAACLSVLTEIDHFQGHDDYLIQARAAVDLPALRKDFMLTPYQIAESRALGADCILIIMAALGDAQARELEDAAHGYGMDVLVEVHDEDEMARALKSLTSPLLGVNNRNLKTLKTDIGVTERLADLLPAGKTLVSESGLTGPADLARMARAGARCFLVGESLMRQPDVTAATKALLGPVRVPGVGMGA